MAKQALAVVQLVRLLVEGSDRGSSWAVRVAVAIVVDGRAAVVGDQGRALPTAGATAESGGRYQER